MLEEIFNVKHSSTLKSKLRVLFLSYVFIPVDLPITVDLIEDTTEVIAKSILILDCILLIKQYYQLFFQVSSPTEMHGLHKIMHFEFSSIQNKTLVICVV